VGQKKLGQKKLRKTGAIVIAVVVVLVLVFFTVASLISAE
jgi:preprotein translocase subunit SecE